jgi:hypothetical protein
MLSFIFKSSVGHGIANLPAALLQDLPHMTLASLLHSQPAMPTVRVTEEPPHANLNRGDVQWPQPPSSALT